MTVKRKAKAQASCDYCGSALACEAGSVTEGKYFRLSIGSLACDGCLQKASKDFPDYAAERLLALRLREVLGVNLASIDGILTAAEPLVNSVQLDKLREERAAVFELHRAGELVAAMAAGQALWNSANHLHESMAGRRERLAGRGSIKGGLRSASQRKRNPLALGKKTQLVIEEFDRYQGAPDALKGTLARRADCSIEHVRKVLDKHRPEWR